MPARPLVSHLCLSSKHSLQPISNEESTHSLATVHNLSGNIHFAAVSPLNRHGGLVNLCHRKAVQRKIKLWNLWAVLNDKHRAEEQRMWACAELTAGGKKRKEECTEESPTCLVMSWKSHWEGVWGWCVFRSEGAMRNWRTSSTDMRFLSTFSGSVLALCRNIASCRVLLILLLAPLFWTRVGWLSETVSYRFVAAICVLRNVNNSIRRQNSTGHTTTWRCIGWYGIDLRSFAKDTQQYISISADSVTPVHAVFSCLLDNKRGMPE